MLILALIESFSCNILMESASQAITISFSPVRLAVFAAWMYSCLYFAQRIQYSPLISKNYRVMAGIAALVLGPLLLVVLLVRDMLKKSAGNRRSIVEIVREQLKNLVSSGMKSGGGDSVITIIDSSGRNIKELYGHTRKDTQDNRILNLTEQIILNAIYERASDILIDPKSNSVYTVRFRVDGVLREVEQIDADTCTAIVNSIKVVSNMDIAEKRRPQDGSFSAKTGDDAIVSFRVASAGVLNGQKLSIRLLNQNADTFTLESVGLLEKQRAVIEVSIKKPSGMVLMCGPTGSGKTTTLYGMLNRIDLTTRNVITVEDPIEYILPYASQIEVNPKADITFAKSLRSILRQDPDVICVGEIRDEETAAIALQASQTGHLVLATIHTTSNAAALVRLLDLGVTPLLMASGLSLVISQRLVRLLCEDCKKPAELTKGQLLDFRKQKVNYRNIYQAVGCEKCRQTGYYGRTAIYDFLMLNDNLRDSIANNDLLMTQLRKNGDRKGRSNLQKQGLRKVVSGVTSLDELKRVVG